MFLVSLAMRRLSVGQRTALGLTRSMDDRESNVISVNVVTSSKSIIQLRDVGGKQIIFLLQSINIVVKCRSSII